MAKDNQKPLLNESTVRRFMKLAEIDKLSGKFVTDLYEQPVPGLEDEDEGLPPEGEGDLPPAEAEGPVDELPPEEGEEPLGGELPPAPPEGGVGEEELNQFVEDVIVGMQQAAVDLGVDVDVEGAASAAAGGAEGDLGALEEPALGEPELGDEEELGEPELGDEEELGEPEPEGEEDITALEEKLADVIDDEALVNEVAKRVAARLIRASKRAKKS